MNHSVDDHDEADPVEGGRSNARAEHDPRYKAALVDLFGVLAYGELGAFERLAADAALAPGISDKIALADMATAEFRHFLALRDRLVQLGAEPEEAMQPFQGPIDEFHAQTKPADWLEGLVKAFVGDGIAMDFYREVAAYVDADSRALILDTCSDLGQSEFVVGRVQDAIAAQPRVAGRLALWGRRLMGEAISQAQRVVAERDLLATLILTGGPEGKPGAGVDLTEIGHMLTRLSDNHARRMGVLGLTP